MTRAFSRRAKGLMFVALLGAVAAALAQPTVNVGTKTMENSAYLGFYGISRDINEMFFRQYAVRMAAVPHGVYLVRSVQDRGRPVQVGVRY